MEKEVTHNDLQEKTFNEALKTLVDDFKKLSSALDDYIITMQTDEEQKNI